MAKADILKFRELLLSDAEFQEKLRKAGEAYAYTGEKDDKSIFENVLVPVAGEYGLSATYEEFKDYIDAFSKETDGELSEDELTQVAGGKGNGAVVCVLGGVGVGLLQSEKAKSGCFVLGIGLGICVYEGASTEV